jgi:protein-disulfide isomerase
MAIVSALAVIVGAILVLVGTRPAAAPKDLVLPATSYSTTLTDGTALGVAGAPVVIQLYADFQCPACKQLVTAQLPRLIDDFITLGTLRIEAKDIDLIGKGSPNESIELAAGAACAAEQDRYWQFHDLVFWNQGRENRGDHDAAFIARVANQAGLDVTAWNACNARPDVRASINTRTSQAFSAGVSSTPTLVINGHVVVGVQGYEQLAAMIAGLAGSPAPSTSLPSPSAS